MLSEAPSRSFGMIGEFMTWWGEQLLRWLPESLRQRHAGRANAPIVRLPDSADAASLDNDDTLLEGIARSNQKETALGRFAVDAAGLLALRQRLDLRLLPANIILRLPASLLLERSVVLPLAAERAPQRVLEYEMDRLTPFTPDDVYWVWASERRDPARGQLHVRLSLVPKSPLRKLIAALEAAGMVPTTLEVPRAQGVLRLIDLRHPPSPRERRRRRSLAVACAGCAALAVVSVVVPFIEQALAQRALERKIEALQPKVAQAAALRRRLASETSSIDAITTQRAQSGNVLQVLASITDILPDDTYLTGFKLRQRRLELQGQSAAAAKLIAALAADPLIRNPVFAAPVTRTGVGRADLFTIRADIAP